MNFPGDVTLATVGGGVAAVEMHRPPANYFDRDVLGGIADALERVDSDPATRAVVLCAEGKHFSAGANFSETTSGDQFEATAAFDLKEMYRLAERIFRTQKPIVAAVHGAAVGGGLGLACSADFRVAHSGSRLSANFATIGYHHGFGLSVTLPRIIGWQHSVDLLYTGRRISGAEAAGMGLVDRLAGTVEVREEAITLAEEIARCAPLSVAAIRSTMRRGLLESVREAFEIEANEQLQLRVTNDFAEGVAAINARRPANFDGR